MYVFQCQQRRLKVPPNFCFTLELLGLNVNMVIFNLLSFTKVRCSKMKELIATSSPTHHIPFIKVSC